MKKKRPIRILLPRNIDFDDMKDFLQILESYFGSNRPELKVYYFGKE